MMSPENLRNQKVMEVLELLSLPEDELTLAEACFLGEKGEEAFGQFTFRDLSGVPSDKSVRVFRDLMKRGRKEEMERLFRILFAIGQSTCYQLVPMDMMNINREAFACEPDMKASIYGTFIGLNAYALRGNTIKNLIDMAQGSGEVLKRALSYQKNSIENGSLVLLTAYFMTQYPWTEEKREKKKGNFLEGVGKFLGLKNNDDGPEILIAPEDEPLMKKYEDIILSRFGALFENKMSAPSVKEIVEAVYNDKVTDKILQIAGTNGVSPFLLRLFGGTAYLNYPLSSKLKNIVRVCLSAHGNWVVPSGKNPMLDAMVLMSESLPMNILVKGGNYDKVFGIEAERYISWAAGRGCKPILKAQLNNNRDAYLKVMDKAELESVNRMFEAVKEQDPALYENLLLQRKQQGHNKDMEKLIGVFVGKDYKDANTIKEYLRGAAPVDTLYPIADQISQQYYYGGGRERNLLRDYMKNYHDEAFFRRCQIYMLLKRSSYFFHEDIKEGNKVKPKKVKALFEGFAVEGLAVSFQLSGVIMIYDALYLGDWKSDFLKGAEEGFAVYMTDKREETINAFLGAEAVGRFFGLRVMGRAAEENKKEILGFSQDNAKMVKEELLNILYGQKDWEEEMKDFLHSKKAAERELAIRVLLRWQEGERDYNELFLQALEREKNAKVRGLLENAMKVEKEGASGSRALTCEDLVKELHKGGKKRTLAWAYDTPFSPVHKKNGEEAPEEYLQAILLCYSYADGCGVSKNAAILAQDLAKEELAVYVNELFDKWMEAGAEAKKRWVLYAASIHGGFEIIKKLQHQIQEWPQNARGAIASEAVQALSLNPLPQALLIVDGISRKFKFKQVKAAAGKALEFAASQLGISREELADRIVPDLGFDENMERKFDYGERSFKVTITPALEIEVYDENGKKLKNMPAPGKRDDEQKAAAAYEEFKQMKKQMKMTISSQKMRLEMALSTEREWSVAAWKELFVKNPVMHQFAIGLIWGTYENRKLVRSFRYMEDGSFNTEEEEEYELPETGQIGLVHPIELSEESLEAWKQQLEDYEISQPLEQLERTVYKMTEEEAAGQSLERFGGCVINDLSLGGKLTGLGWYRGSVQDGGGFYTYYREDTELSLGVELHFSGSFVGGENDDVTVYDARFYKAGTIERGSYVYDEAGKEKAYFLREVPERYFSEIVWQLTKATASSQEKNGNWKEERGKF